MFYTDSVVDQSVLLNNPLVIFQTVSETQDATISSYPPMSLRDYYGLVKNLVQKGRVEGKRASVIAFDLHDLGIRTNQDTGIHETAKTLVAPEKMILFDPTYFTVEKATKVMQKAFALYGKEITSEKVLQLMNTGQKISSHISAVGVWDVDRKKFYSAQTRGAGYKGDYVPADEPFVYKTLPGTGRLIASHLGADQSMLVQWKGGFNIRTGAGIASYLKDVPGIVDAVKKVEAAGGTDEAIQKYLCTKDPASREILATFDIYGMFPAFRENNYAPIKAEDISEDGIMAVRAVATMGNTKAASSTFSLN